jgi:hypothetical protein
LKEGLERDATIYFEYGDKGEGYWTGEDIVQQVLNKAIPVFEKEYGKECKACFLFDNSSNHVLRVQTGTNHSSAIWCGQFVNGSRPKQAGA